MLVNVGKNGIVVCERGNTLYDTVGRGSNDSLEQRQLQCSGEPSLLGDFHFPKKR